MTLESQFQRLSQSLSTIQFFDFKNRLNFAAPNRRKSEKTRGYRDLAPVPGERRPMVVAMVENETAGEDRRREGVGREEVKRGSYVR